MSGVVVVRVELWPHVLQEPREVSAAKILLQQEALSEVADIELLSSQTRAAVCQ